MISPEKYYEIFDTITQLQKYATDNRDACYTFKYSDPHAFKKEMLWEEYDQLLQFVKYELRTKFAKQLAEKLLSDMDENIELKDMLKKLRPVFDED